MQTNIVGIVITIITIVMIVTRIYQRFRWREHKRYYFVADEVIFEITHPTGTSPTTIRTALQQDFLDPQINNLKPAGVENTPRANRNWRKLLQSPALLADSRIITFQSLNDRSVSLVPIPLVSASLIRGGHWKRDLRPNDVISVLNGAYAELQDLPRELRTGILLRSLSPNWLTSNLHHGGATGGPGSWPLSENPTSPNLQNIRLMNPTPTSFQSTVTSGKKVKVAILDTAPVSAADETRIRTLIPGLVSVSYENNSPGNSQNLNGLRPYTPPSEHIQMPDHGTFVASIVDSIAGNAVPIHLYEVLNDYGVGTFTIVARGLRKVIDQFKNQLIQGQTHLIINCSFMFRVPPGEDLLADLKVPMSALGVSMRKLFEEEIKNIPNITVVAAAGNDNSAGSGRPDACYPAAFKNVISVGALPNDNYPPDPRDPQRYAVSSYSNLSFSREESKPAEEGYMTFGGELDNPGAVSGTPISSNGLVGVYVGPISTRVLNGPIVSNPNSTTWARWAGTSFAAPIITGLLAIGFTLPRPSPYLTFDNENVIKVKQP